MGNKCCFDNFTDGEAINKILPLQPNNQVVSL